MEYKEYIKSEEWKKLRKLAYKKANYKCEHCKKPAQAVHHIKYSLDFEDDNLNNLIVVCKKCHKLYHGIKDEKTHICVNKIEKRECEGVEYYGNRLYDIYELDILDDKWLCGLCESELDR